MFDSVILKYNGISGPVQKVDAIFSLRGSQKGRLQSSLNDYPLKNLQKGDAIIYRFIYEDPSLNRTGMILLEDKKMFLEAYF